MPNKREGVVLYIYIIPIHLLLSLIIIIYIIEAAFFLIWRLAFGKLGRGHLFSNNPSLLPDKERLFHTSTITLKKCAFLLKIIGLLFAYMKYFS